MSKIMQLIGLVNGPPTEHDGRWLVEYQPRSLLLRTTDNRAEALRFPNTMAAIACYRQVIGTRPDGKPDRPLTAFTISIEDADGRVRVGP